MNVTAFGDSALLVTCSSRSAEASWQAAHGLAERLRAVSPSGVYEIVPTYDSVLVEFDCAVTTHADVERAVHEASAAHDLEATPAESRHFRVPTVYGGEEGPDLSDVAAHLGLDTREVVARHSAAPLRIRCLTFPIASPMLDGAAFPADVPRRTTPRTTMAGGVVMVAGRQTVVSPLSAPTGWQIIGRTPCQLVDLAGGPIAPYRAGDWLHFVQADRREWDVLLGQPLERLDA